MKNIFLVFLCTVVGDLFSMDDALPRFNGQLVTAIKRDENEHGESFFASLYDGSSVSAEVRAGVEDFALCKVKFNYFSVQHCDQRGIAMALGSHEYYSIKNLYNKHFRDKESAQRATLAHVAVKLKQDEEKG